MTACHRLFVLATALALAACAAPANRAAVAEPAVSAAPSAPPAPAMPEPPRQADQLARIASELVELQNAVAKVMMSTRQHDDQLIYLQRRLAELESQARGRPAVPPGFAPSMGVPAPLPPPPIGPPAALPPSGTLPPTTSPRAPAPASAAPPPTSVSAARPAPPAPVAPQSPSASASAAEMLYQSGVAKYEAGDPDAAVVTLYEVVVNFPKDPARERAQLLVGKIFLAQKDYRGAVAELESLIAAVPGGSRVPDALLKLGVAHRSLGDEGRARRAWERLVKEFPASAAARQARTLLKAARG